MPNRNVCSVWHYNFLFPYILILLIIIKVYDLNYHYYRHFFLKHKRNLNQIQVQLDITKRIYQKHRPNLQRILDFSTVTKFINNYFIFKELSQRLNKSKIMNYEINLLKENKHIIKPKHYGYYCECLMH